MKMRVPKLGQLAEASGYLRAINDLAKLATVLPSEPGRIVLDLPESFFCEFFESDESDAEPEAPEGDALDQDEDECDVLRPGTSGLAFSPAAPR